MIRQIHFTISAALAAAVRWEWVTTNPALVAKKARQPRPQPDPVGAENVVRLCHLRYVYSWRRPPRRSRRSTGRSSTGGRGAVGWVLGEGPVRPVGVVVIDVDREDVFEVTAVDDQHPVQQLTVEAAGPAFADRVGTGARAGVRGIVAPIEVTAASKAAV
jgi:hypothetical protein